MGTEEPTPITLSIGLFSTKLQLDQKTMTLNRSTWERFGGRSAKRHGRKMKPGSNCEEHNVRDWQTTPTGRLCSVESTYPIMCILKVDTSLPWSWVLTFQFTHTTYQRNRRASYSHFSYHDSF